MAIARELSGAENFTARLEYVTDPGPASTKESSADV